MMSPTRNQQAVLEALEALVRVRAKAYTVSRLVGMLGWPTSKVKRVVDQLNTKQVVEIDEADGDWHVYFRDRSLWLIS